MFLLREEKKNLRCFVCLFVYLVSRFPAECFNSFYLVCQLQTKGEPHSISDLVIMWEDAGYIYRVENILAPVFSDLFWCCTMCV